ncbi:MAG TPA: phasin family protein [Xanthobacteraceae bacterium]|nr:phasin family protein [Xanthobacteraceae bacterium]
MVKVEEFQQFGKEQLDATMASAANFSKGFQALATAYGEISKKSFEEGSAYVEKLSSVKSLDKAIELQTEYARNSYEAFVAGSQKIGELYADLAKQAYKPFEGYVAKFNSGNGSN